MRKDMARTATDKTDQEHDIERPTWEPTEEQLTAYLQKEVVMARANLPIARRRSQFVQTLHSRRTLLVAILS